MKNKKHRKIIERLLLLLPLVLLFIIFTFFSYMFKYNDKMHFESVYEDCKYAINMVSEATNRMDKEGIHPDNELFFDIIESSLSYLDGKKGIDIRIVTKDFKSLPLSHQEGYSDFFIAENENFVKLMNEMKFHDTGEMDLIDQQTNSHVKVYWKIVPDSSPEFYLVASVSSQSVEKSFDFTQFEIGLSVIAIITIVSVYDSIWMRIKDKDDKDNDK